MSILNLRSEDPTPEIVESDALDDTPPGLDAIRSWLRKPHPWFRGVWLWVRWILRGLRDAFRFLATNAPRAAEKVRVVARKGAPVVRAAARVGQGVQRVGVRMSAAAGAFRDPEGKNLGAERNVRRAGLTTRQYGERITAGSEVAGALLSVLGSVAGVFTPKPPISINPDVVKESPEDTEDAPEPGGRFLPRQPDKRPSAPTGGRTEPVPDPPQPGADPDSGGNVKETAAELPHESRTSGEAAKTPPEPSQEPPASAEVEEDPAHSSATDAPEPDPEVPPEAPTPDEAEEDPAHSSAADAPEPDPEAPPEASAGLERRTPPPTPPAPPEDRFEGVPKELLLEVKSIHGGERLEPLRPLILSICLAREWTTAKQLARWLSAHRRSLVQRHLGPLVDQERLILRFPDKVRSRNQAYRTNPEKWPPRR